MGCPCAVAVALVVSTSLVRSGSSTRDDCAAFKVYPGAAYTHPSKEISTTSLSGCCAIATNALVSDFTFNSANSTCMLYNKYFGTVPCSTCTLGFRTVPPNSTGSKPSYHDLPLRQKFRPPQQTHVLSYFSFICFCQFLRFRTRTKLMNFCGTSFYLARASRTKHQSLQPSNQKQQSILLQQNKGCWTTLDLLQCGLACRFDAQKYNFPQCVCKFHVWLLNIRIMTKLIPRHASLQKYSNAELLDMFTWEFQHLEVYHNAPSSSTNEDEIASSFNGSNLIDDTNLNISLDNGYIQNPCTRWVVGGPEPL